MVVRAAAYLLGAVHLAYLLYVVLGGWLALRWRITIGAHLAAVGWAVAVVAGHLPCPLTAGQDALRARLGEPPLPGGFIDAYLRGVVFLTGYEVAAQVAVAALVLASWTLYVLRPLRR